MASEGYYAIQTQSNLLYRSSGIFCKSNKYLDYNKNMRENQYAELFWDYPEVFEMAKTLRKEEFKEWINELKKKSEIKRKIILRRFIERARLSELFYFFDVEEIQQAIEDHFWRLSPIRLHAIKYAIELLKAKTFQNV